MKTEVIGIALAFMGAFVAELHVVLFSLGFLIMCDTFTAIWSVIKKQGWAYVTSRKFGRIITKLIFYPLAVIIAKVCQDYIALDTIPIVKATVMTLGLVEVKSIGENLTVILGFNLPTKIKNMIWQLRKEEKANVGNDNNKKN